MLRDNQAAQAQELAQALCTLSVGRGSSCKASRAFIWVLANAKRSSLKAVQDGIYIELCPAYLTSIDGVTSWSARTAWPLLRKAFGWQELTFSEALYTGLPIRNIKETKRHGRHLIFKTWQIAAAVIAANALAHFKLIEQPDSPHSAIRAPAATLTLLRLPNTNGGALSVSCFAHRDKHPSLVLWRNANGKTGGAKCMSCEGRGLPSVWAVSYNGMIAAFTKPRAASKPQVKTKVCRAKSVNRNNKHLHIPIGGLVSTVYGHNDCHYNGLLKGDDDGQLWRVITGTAKDPITVLRWHDKRSQSAAATEKAESLAFYISSGRVQTPQKWRPTNIYSISTMRPCEWGMYGATKWKAVRQGWVLFDIDDINLDGIAKSKASKAISRVISRDSETSGVCAVVQTGPVGLQIWVELREVRHTPHVWHRLPQVVEWYEALGNRIHRAAKKHGGIGGHLDMACCAAGRFGRRPGWRVNEDGTVFRTQLLHYRDNRIESRLPRVSGAYTEKSVKVPVFVKSNTKALKVSNANAGSVRGGTLADRITRVPSVPQGREHTPRQEPHSVSLSMPKKNN